MPPLSITQLAKRLNLSKTTVSRSINNTPGSGISPTTRKRVIEEARRLGYKPSMVAQTLAHQRTKIIGVVVPMIGNTVYSPMVRGVEQAAYERGYNIILCDTDVTIKKEIRYLDMLVRRRVEGVVIIPFAERANTDYRHIIELESMDIKTVIMEQDIPIGGLSRVVQDNRGDARRMTEHLISLGYKRIGFAFLDILDWDISGKERWEGYKQALGQADIGYDEELLLQAGLVKTEEENCLLFDAIVDYLRRPERPEAIFAATDMLAIKIMSVIRHLGLRVPEDIAVVGFDDILTSGYINPPLTTVRQPAQQIGQEAAKVLFDLIDNEGTPRPTVHERIKGELVIRESCGCKKNV